MDAESKQLKADIDSLRDQIYELVTKQENALVSAGSRKSFPPCVSIKERRRLRGHFGKVYSMHWSSDSLNLVSASQDGKLIIWNAFTGNKLEAIPLRSSWVMTCAFSPSGNFVASGGLDNICSIFKATGGHASPTAELAQHDGYLSCCRFIGDDEVVTCSGDSTCILWDVTKRMPKNVFDGHTGDVMSVSVFDHKDIFVSGSCDTTAKLWDHRNRNACVGTFHGHESDINSVKFFPDGNAFCSGSDDSKICMFDVRARRVVQILADDKVLCGITSVDYSSSGRFIAAGYDDYTCQVWDVTNHMAQLLSTHDNRVSSVGISENGKALCTASWDTFLRIWA